MFGSLLAGLLITVWPVMLYWNMFGSLLLGRHVGPRVGLIVVCCILAIIEVLKMCFWVAQHQHLDCEHVSSLAHYHD